MAYRLIIQTGISTGTEFPLEKAELLIGRDLSNDIVISDPEVSRRHARLVLTGNTYAIEDLGSTNGTFLRGRRLTSPVVLTPGEVITFGENMQLKFDFAMVDPDATVAAFRRPAPGAEVPVTPRPAPMPSEPPVTPAPQPFSPRPTPPRVEQASQVQIPSQPVGQGYTPIQPPEPVFESPAPVVRKKRSGWLVALLVVIGILLVFCIIPWLIIEVTNSYCALFPGIFNAIQPGVCP
ncbi:MAG: FHA domain-containing protein [Anaerolineaceae bacterium]|jgi:predicted component of type VI protein secretion system